MTDNVKRVTVDRLEGDKAMIEGLGSVPRALLPKALKEGDVLVVTVEDERVSLAIDAEAKAGREREMKELRDSLVKADTPDDGLIEL